MKTIARLSVSASMLFVGAALGAPIGLIFVIPALALAFDR